MEEEYEVPPEDTNDFDPIDVYLFQEEVTDSFRKIMDKITKIVKKQLVVEDAALKRLNYFITPKDLADFNFESSFRLLENEELECDPKVIVYLITPSNEALASIEWHMEQYDKKRKEDPKKYYEREYNVIFIPKVSNKCFNYIKASRYSSYFKVFNLTIDCFPLDYDLLSLENNESFKDVFITNDYDSLVTFARITAKFEDLFGKIKYRYIKGDNAKVVNDLLAKNESELEVDNTSEILASIFIDRTVDLITPFVTPATYEGLLDEYFNIVQNRIRVDSTLLKEIKPVQPQEPKEGEEENEESEEEEEKQKQKQIVYSTVLLNKTDRFYYMIREYTFQRIRHFLPTRVKQHKEILSTGKEVGDFNFQSIQSSLIKVKAVQLERKALADHVYLANFISKSQMSPTYKLNIKIEQRLLNGDYSHIFRDVTDSMTGNGVKSSFHTLIRLLSLESLTQGGFKDFNELKKDIYLSFGFQEIFLLNNLEKFKIFKKFDKFNLYKYLSERLNLISTQKVDYNMAPNDPVYAFGGYVPTSVRLIQKIFDGGWNSIVDVLNKLPGVAEYPKEENELVYPFKEVNYVFVGFIGGITFGEIAAIRFLNKLNPRYKFIILTTSIINSKSFIDQLRFIQPEKDEKLTYSKFFSTYVEINPKKK